MASSEAPHYLHPDFDPWKLKMDQIREILIQHHVRTPTGIVKKQQLVDLFIQHIRPQVPEITQAEKDADSNDHAEKTSTTKARQPRSTKAQKEEEPVEPTPTKPARVKRASSKLALESEETPEVKPKLKRSNSRAKVVVDKSDTESKTTETPRGRSRKPIVQSEDDNEPIVKPTRVKRVTKEAKEKKKAKNENFSNENPFQSGSESERSRSRPRSRGRKPKVADKASSSAARDHVFKVPAQPAFSKFMQAPPQEKTEPPKSTTQPKPRDVSIDDLPEPKTLILGASQPDFQEILQNMRRQLVPITLAISAVLLAYGIWLRQTRIDIGFCTETELESPTSRAWYYPTCIPCPDHATCLRSDAEPICSPEYLLKPQLLSFGNLFPITPVCVLNKAKEYQSLQVADAAEKLLHLYAGNVECSLSREKLPLNSAEYKARRSISTEDLRSQVEQLKDANISDEDFSQYWERALRELHRRSDKVSFEQGLDGEERIRSLKPQRSLGCRLRQALVGWIIKFKLLFLALASSALGGFAIRAHVLNRRKQGRVISGLVQNVLSKLSDQAHYYYVDPVIYPDPFLPQTQLRDALLMDVSSPTRRQEIWSKVEAVVERNSNVRTSSQEVRGELYKTWEWIGPSGVLSQPGIDSRAGNANFHNEVGSQAMFGGGIRARGTPKVPPRTGPHGSFFGIRRQDSEYLNPENSLYPSLSQEYSQE
ncbi:inner nuclear membrane protein enriched at telomere/subtelomere region [Entomortierella chlamydospora]|uniref:Inner nuclear membrane protein enriched at telomere/subtelomere region n=1 Tax=Entomortierella chlamydospora TaxID=101097 RepID=A0A9P6SYJ1_9FUNG|nr:inner nuclear membrane protein enriched at telomere/subtelomere region [Entomortierella chlamydospora]KAG0011921.1 inner nuclear membrane protein enriched at telomere/subtelomere region [Entomortierella chlamydospora]